MGTRFPIESVPAPAFVMDFSGYTVAGQSVEIIPAQTGAWSYRFQNIDETTDIWINDTGAAAGRLLPGSYLIVPGGYYEYSGSGPVSVYSERVVPFSAARCSYADV